MDDKIQPTPGTSVNPSENPRVSIPVMDDVRVPAANSTLAMNPNQSPSVEEVMREPIVENSVVEAQASGPVEVQNTFSEPARMTEPSIIQPLVETNAQVSPVPTQQPKKKGGSRIVIILAVAVVVVLAGVAVYVYMQSNKNNEPESTTVITKEVKVTSDDAEATITDIEKEINSQNEDTDFKVDALSDATLTL